nr:hypothetical protein [Tanacetum cinerariifolium]
MKAKQLEFETKVAECPGKGLPYYHIEEEAARSVWILRSHGMKCMWKHSDLRREVNIRPNGLEMAELLVGFAQQRDSGLQ